mgnify:CR=1 FL=1
MNVTQVSPLDSNGWNSAAKSSAAPMPLFDAQLPTLLDAQQRNRTFVVRNRAFLGAIFSVGSSRTIVRNRAFLGAIFSAGQKGAPRLISHRSSTRRRDVLAVIT